MAAVRKEGGPAMAPIQGDGRRDGSPRSAGGRDPDQRASGVGSEDDDSVAIPAPSPAVGRFSNRFGWAPRCVDLAELASGEEGDEAAVGRPKWTGRPFGSRERMR